MPTLAHAAGSISSYSFIPDIQQTIATGVSYVITLLNVGTWILFVFLNYLLDPAFIFNLGDTGNTSNFTDMLNQIWQLSRDLMNVIFAVLLVGTAVYTIVTAKKDFIAQHAKNFVLAIILVNFSWFLPRMVIDVANVATSTVYGIPSLLSQSTNGLAACKVRCDAVDPNANTSSGFCPCQIVTNAKFLQDSTTAETLENNNNGWNCYLGGLMCVQEQIMDEKTVSGHSAVLNGLIINHAMLGKLAQVPRPVNDSDVEEMVTFLVQEMIIVIIHVALFFPLLAMVVAFMIRIPVLWITMAFMPFWFLGFISEKLSFEGYTKKLLDYFLKAAFLPAMVAVPLTVGFIMINAGAQTTSTVNDATKLPIRLLDSIDNIWSLLWLGMTLGVIWVGIFAVLSKVEFAAKISQSIKGFGEAAGRLVLKAPLAAPIIPGPGGGRLPMLSALKTAHPRNLERIIEGPEGLAGIPKAFTAGAHGAVADKFGSHPEEVGKLHEDLVKLTDLMSRPGVKREEVEHEIGDINRRHGTSFTDRGFTKDGLQSQIKDFVEQIKKSAEKGGKKDEVTKETKNIEVNVLSKFGGLPAIP
jgi:hypothetical protein